MTGVRPEGMAAFGFCPTCGAELARGEPHASTCAEDGFVDADPEYKKLQRAAGDAYDDLQTARQRHSARNAARMSQKYERAESARLERERTLRTKYRHDNEPDRLRIQHRKHAFELAIRTIEGLENHESLEQTHIGESHYFTRAMAIKEAVAAIQKVIDEEEKTNAGPDEGKQKHSTRAA